jgi:hypothetical protein
MMSFNYSELVLQGVKWVDVYFFVFLNFYICWYRAYINQNWMDDYTRDITFTMSPQVQYDYSWVLTW